MEIVRAIEREIRIEFPRLCPRIARRQQQTVDAFRGIGVRARHLWRRGHARFRRPHHEQRRARAGRANLDVESPDIADQLRARLRQRRRPLLQHDDVPDAATDGDNGRAFVPVVGQTEIILGDRRRRNRRACILRQLLDRGGETVRRGETVADEQHAERARSHRRQDRRAEEHGQRGDRAAQDGTHPATSCLTIAPSSTTSPTAT